MRPDPERNDAARGAPAITPPFTFSQSSLRDFDACRRLFYLRWVERTEWPATPASEARERDMEVRRRFHHLLHQHFVGVDVGTALEAEPAGSDLRAWWEAFQQYPPPLPAGRRYAEVTLSAPIGEHRLVATYDLLAVSPAGEMIIADWKTGQHFPDPLRLADDWQTCVYLYLLAVAGEPYGGGPPPAPERMAMLYWFAEYPASPARLAYSAGQHAEYGRRLRAAIAAIAALPAAAFTATDDPRACERCAYQGYCGRGAGEPAGSDDADAGDEDWDWSDVPEYEY